MIEVFWMHILQGEKYRVEKGTLFQRISGTRGQGEPEDTSQKMEVLRKGMETTEREGLDSIAWMEGQADWRAG